MKYFLLPLTVFLAMLFGYSLKDGFKTQTNQEINEIKQRLQDTNKVIGHGTNLTLLALMYAMLITFFVTSVIVFPSWFTILFSLFAIIKNCFSIGLSMKMFFGDDDREIQRSKFSYTFDSIFVATEFCYMMIILIRLFIE